jgi:hypothetical protein
MNKLHFIAVASIAAACAACKPAGPPPDLMKTQREALDKAKDVNRQVLQQAEEQKKAVEDATK